MYKEITVIYSDMEYLTEIDSNVNPQLLVEYIKRELGLSGEYYIAMKSGNLNTDNLVVELIESSYVVVDSMVRNFKKIQS